MNDTGGGGNDTGQLVLSIPSSQADVMIQEADYLGHNYKASDWQITNSGTWALNSKVSQLCRDAEVSLELNAVDCQRLEKF